MDPSHRKAIDNSECEKIRVGLFAIEYVQGPLRPLSAPEVHGGRNKNQTCDYTRRYRTDSFQFQPWKRTGNRSRNPPYEIAVDNAENRENVADKWYRVHMRAINSPLTG